MLSTVQPGRIAQVNRAIRLEYFTVFYNVAEGLVSIVLGNLSNSIALIGFGLDSFVESFSGLIVLRRFRLEKHGLDHREVELRALRWVGYSFLFLAMYIAFESVRKLWLREEPDPSVAGILLAVFSLIVMPVLARKKYVTGTALKSSAMVGDSKQTLACSLLSVTLLIGLMLNAVAGWWWADPVAALALIPWLVREGKEALGGDTCC